MNITLRRYCGTTGRRGRRDGGNGAGVNGATVGMVRERTARRCAPAENGGTVGGTTTAQLRCAYTRVGWEAEPPTPHAHRTSGHVRAYLN